MVERRKKVLFEPPDDDADPDPWPVLRDAVGEPEFPGVDEPW